MKTNAESLRDLFFLSRKSIIRLEKTNEWMLTEITIIDFFIRQVITMMYPYMTLGDGTEIVHSQVINENGTEKVIVHFEKPVDDGFYDARCELPTYLWTEKRGFSDEDIALFTKLLESNAHLIYRYAASGGVSIA